MAHRRVSRNDGLERIVMHKADFLLDGKPCPSVTEILGDRPKPWLDKWREKWGVLADRKTACANAIGTRFHEGAEALVWDRQVLASGRVYNMLASFETWREESKFIPKQTELHVISRKHWYHGTFDAVGYLNGSKALVIFDWKTSSAIYPEAAEQMAAYAIAYEEETGLKIKKGYIIHVSKDKPLHKLTEKGYTLGKRLRSKFLKRLAEFNGGRHDR